MYKAFVFITVETAPESEETRRTIFNKVWN